MKTITLDVHSEICQMAVVTEEGELVYESKVETTPRSVTSCCGWGAWAQARNLGGRSAFRVDPRRLAGDRGRGDILRPEAQRTHRKCGGFERRTRCAEACDVGTSECAPRGVCTAGAIQDPSQSRALRLHPLPGIDPSEEPNERTVSAVWHPLQRHQDLPQSGPFRSPRGSSQRHDTLAADQPLSADRRIAAGAGGGPSDDRKAGGEGRRGEPASDDPRYWALGRPRDRCLDCRTRPVQEPECEIFLRRPRPQARHIELEDYQACKSIEAWSAGAQTAPLSCGSSGHSKQKCAREALRGPAGGRLGRSEGHPGPGPKDPLHGLCHLEKREGVQRCVSQRAEYRTRRPVSALKATTDQKAPMSTRHQTSCQGIVPRPDFRESSSDPLALKALTVIESPVFTSPKISWVGPLFEGTPAPIDGCLYFGNNGLNIKRILSQERSLNTVKVNGYRGLLIRDACQRSANEMVNMTLRNQTIRGAGRVLFLLSPFIDGSSPRSSFR